MPYGTQSLISDIFNKISEVRTLTSPSNTNTLPQNSTTTPSEKRTRTVRLKTRSVRTLRSTTHKPKQKEINPYKKQNLNPPPINKNSMLQRIPIAVGLVGNFIAKTVTL